MLDLACAQALALDLVYLRNYVAANYTVSSDCDRIELVASKADFSTAIGTCTFVGKRQRSLDGVASATLTTHSSRGKKLDAGLVVFKDSYRHAEIFYSAIKNKIVFSWENYWSGKMIVEESKPVDSGEIEFKVEATEEKHLFHSRSSGHEWVKSGEVDSLSLTCQGFTGPIFGIFAFGEGEVEFKHVQINSNLSMEDWPTTGIDVTRQDIVSVL